MNFRKINLAIFICVQVINRNAINDISQWDSIGCDYSVRNGDINIGNKTIVSCLHENLLKNASVLSVD